MFYILVFINISTTLFEVIVLCTIIIRFYLYYLFVYYIMSSNFFLTLCQSTLCQSITCWQLKCCVQLLSVSRNHSPAKLGPERLAEDEVDERIQADVEN